MVNVRKDYDRFRAAGGDVAAITMGTPEQVSGFRERLKLPFPCFADPQRVAYQAFGVERGSLGQVAGPAVWVRGGLALLRRGGGKPVGDPLQLHAAFVVNGGGVLRFVHYPRNSADLPSHDKMVSAIKHCSERAS